MIELWRQVVGYEGWYEVSSAGRVRCEIGARRSGSRGGELAQAITRDGYPNVTLSREGNSRNFRVHVLVAEAFLGPRPELNEVRHLDGRPRNNSLFNLRWGTRIENGADTLAHGRNANANKTHCPQGHPYDEGNTRTEPKRRRCITCSRASVRRFRQRVREERADELAPMNGETDE